MNFPGHLMGNLLCKNGLRYRRGRLFQKVHRNTGIGKVLLSVGNGLGGNVLSDTMDKRFDVPAQTISAVEKEWMRSDKF